MAAARSQTGLSVYGSVLGDNGRTRREAIVDANRRDEAGLADIRHEGRRWRRLRQIEGGLAEVVVVGFAANRPVLRQCEFGTESDGPAGARVAVRTRASDARQ